MVSRKLVSGAFSANQPMSRSGNRSLANLFRTVPKKHDCDESFFALASDFCCTSAILGRDSLHCQTVTGPDPDPKL